MGDVDALFQLPLEQFTAARNELAKRSGKDGAAIRQLTRPPVAAWAVNQLYWRDRKTYDALVAAAGELRKAHKAVLAGRTADLRAAGREHDKALDAALKSTLRLLTDSGHSPSDATRQAVVNTLRALPADEPPGRLTRTLQPGGFEALSGFSIAAAPLRAAPSKPKPAAKKAGTREKPADTARDRKALAAATEALRRAEHDAKREEFERARAAREADRAARAVERAREGVERAQQLLEDAQQELEAAQEAANQAAVNRDKAEQRAASAEEKLEAARQAMLAHRPAGT